MVRKYLSVGVIVCVLVLLLVIAVSSPLTASQPAPIPDRGRVAQGLQSAPLMFIENAGQFDARARFQVRGAGGTLWLAEEALWITVIEPPTPHPSPTQGGGEAPLSPRGSGAGDEGEPRRGVNIKLSFVGANPHLRLEPFNRLETHVSYFLGNDPTKWHADVPVWGSVRYVNLYPGIDLELSGEGGRWQPRIIAQPGTDVSAVRLRVEGTDEIALDGDALRMSTAVGPVTLPPLLTGDGALLQPTIVNDAIAFALYPFNPFPESVDSSPQDNPAHLLYSTFLGGSGDDYGRGIAVDLSGAAYVTGRTVSSDFPTTPGAFQTICGGYPPGCYDSFVTKLNTVGSNLVYSTFLGGNDNDFGVRVSVDGNGAAYVTGGTRSSDFPTTTGAFQTTYGGNGDAFLTKLDATGNGIVYSTFLGGSGSDGGFGIAVDTSGAAYVTGDTGSPTFPTTSGAFQTTFGGFVDAYATKLNAAGSGLTYSTFLGGNDIDGGYDVAVDASGATYVTGSSRSSNFPIAQGAFDPIYNGGSDAFMTKLDATGSALTYSTYLGAGGDENSYRVTVGVSGESYVTGRTTSSDFPTTAGAFQTVYGGSGDGFVTKINTGGSALTYSTFLGGINSDSGHGIVVTASGVIYVAGFTGSPNFPTTPGAFQTIYGGGSNDAYLTKLLPVAGSGLEYSTFLGGSGWDGSYDDDIAVDGGGAAYVASSTTSSNFPTTPGAFQTTCNSCPTYFDAFVTKLLPAVLTDQAYLPLILNNP